MSKHAGSANYGEADLRLDDFDDTPFMEVDRVLKDLKREIGDRPEDGKWSEINYEVEELFDESRKFLEQARRFLKGAEHYEEPRAYEVGEIALDDFKQKVSILTMLYPEETEEIGGTGYSSISFDDEDNYSLSLEEMVSAVNNLKRSVYRSIDDETAVLPRREYEEVVISLEEFDPEKPYVTAD